MSIAICGYHNKPMCKECHHCEDCGINACVHTERGRLTRKLSKQRLAEKGTFTNDDIYQLRKEIDSKLKGV